MVKQSRTRLAFTNAFVTGTVLILYFPIQFINRFFMIKYLGVHYLGITSLYTNILSVLSLADLGIGTAIVFLLYEPLASHDIRKVALLMRYYRNIYCSIAGIIFLLGLLIMPFLPHLMKGTGHYPYVYQVFIIYLLGSASSYLFSYNQSLLFADQKNHIVSIINLIVSYVMLSVQIFTVIILRNPLLYAALFVFTNFVTNLFVSIYVKKNYPFKKSKEKLSKEEKDLLIQNVIGNMFLRISGVVVTGTDNIFLSAFTGVVIVGYYANYVTVTNFIQRFMTQVIGAISGSIGNFAVGKNKNEGEILFHNLQFINFMLLNLACLGIMFLSKDVITLWLGEKFVFDNLTTLLITLSFFFMNYRILGWNFTAVYGLARFMKLFSINEMTVNILCTLLFILVFKMGLNGVLLGTICSTLLTVTWQDPYVIFKHGFNSSPLKYFKRYILNFTIFLLECVLIFEIERHLRIVNQYGLIHFCFYLPIVVLIGIVIPSIFYFSTEELKYLKNLIKQIVYRR